MENTTKNYTKIVDKIIAKKLPPHEAISEILKKIYNVKFIDTYENKKTK